MPTRFDQPLRADDMTNIMSLIIEGRMATEEMREFLTTLARRGETAEEIATAVQVLRKHALPVPLLRTHELCDTCGTGGDGQGTANISTLAALTAAAAGVRIAKHGNRAASGRCGSADLLEALGVDLRASPALIARCIETVGFGFCFAPVFHPAMKIVAPVRRALGIRTLFNLIGPLANPLPLAFQLVGVAESRWLQPMAEALIRLDVRHAMVVHGSDGLDEVTTTGVTEYIEVRDGVMTADRLDPETLGIARATLEQLQGGDVQRNATLARQALAGAASAVRDIVMLNAGCAIYVAGRARTIRDGVALAEQTLSIGRPIEVLERVKELSAHVG